EASTHPPALHRRLARSTQGAAAVVDTRGAAHAARTLRRLYAGHHGSRRHVVFAHQASLWRVSPRRSVRSPSATAHGGVSESEAEQDLAGEAHLHAVVPRS